MQREGVREITKEQEETFGDDGCDYYLDCVMISRVYTYIKNNTL